MNSRLLFTFVKFLLCMVGVIVPTMATATMTLHPRPYSVRYDKCHQLMRNGHDYSVVDLNVEWPEAIDSVAVQSLQRKICSYVFSLDTTDYDVARSSWLNGFGRPVKGLLDSLPDDRRFSYVQASAVIQSHSSRRWIAYQLRCDVTPGPLSSCREMHRRMVVVYDLATGELFTPEDMVNASKLFSRIDYSDVLDSLYAPLDDADFSGLQSSSIVGVWPVDNSVGVQMLCQMNDKAVCYPVFLSTDLFSPYLSKPARRMLRGERCTMPVFLAVSDDSWQGESIVVAPDSLPVFPGGQLAYTQYVLAAARGAYSHSGQVLVSFVVDKHGKAQRICVVSSGGPELDRLAAHIVMDMPACRPGRLQGHAVPVVMTQPFFFK